MTATFKTFEPETRQPKKNDEDTLQATCFRYWNKYYRETSLLFSVPNGQHRNYAEAAIAIATGLTEGISDLVLLLPEATAEFLEMKTATGRQKKAQEKFEANVRRLGFKYYLLRTFEQFQQHLAARLGPPNDSKSNNQGQETGNANQGRNRAEEGRHDGKGPGDSGRREEMGTGRKGRERRPESPSRLNH